MELQGHRGRRQADDGHRRARPGRRGEAEARVDDRAAEPGAAQDRWRTFVGDLDVLWVGVRCDSAVAEGREIARGDRVAGMAAKQADIVHQGVDYDVEVDTTHTESLACARAIASHVA